jgi:hypothetical protein
MEAKKKMQFESSSDDDVDLGQIIQLKHTNPVIDV